MSNTLLMDLIDVIVPDLNADHIDSIQESNGIGAEQLKDKLRACNNMTSENHQDDADCVVDSTQNAIVKKEITDLNGSASADDASEKDPLNGNDEFNDLPTSTDDKPYKCHICGKLFSRNSSLKCHIRLHLEGPENILRSGSAGPPNDSSAPAADETRDGDDTPRRREEIEEDAPYSCIFCDKHFSRKSSLKCHIQFHVKAFQAERCNGDAEAADGKETPRRESSSDVEASPQASPLDKGYTCVICDQRFSRKSSLIMHYRNHPILKMTPEEEELHATDQCCRRFSIDIIKEEQTVAVKEEQVVHCKEEQMVKCEERKRSTSERDEPATPGKGDPLVDDGASGDGDDKQYKCYICDKLFARNSSLMWHIQFHETHMYSKAKKSSDVCTDNGVKYVNDAAFTDDGENRCRICGKTYHSNASLRRHLTYHGKEVQFVNVDMNSEENPTSKEATCELCGRSFINVTSLKKHFSQIHRGCQMRQPGEEDAVDALDDQDGDFKCDACDRSYFSMSSLKRHILSVHKAADETQSPATPAKGTPPLKVVSMPDENGQYKCDQCPKLFDSARAKNIHIAHGHRAAAVEKLVHLAQHKAALENAIDGISYVENADGLYECHLCDRTFDRKKGLSRHVGYHNTDQTAAQQDDQSAQPDDQPDDSSDIDLTIEECDDEPSSTGVFSCRHCNRVFENKKGLSRHIGYHNSMSNQTEGKAPIVCDYCDRSFDSTRAVRAHMTQAHRELLLNDSNPQSESEQEDESEEEEKEEEKEQFECFQCPRVFDSKRARSIHAVQAHKPAPIDESTSKGTTAESHSSFGCPYCDRHFDSGRAMNIHAAAKHPEQVTAAKASMEVHCDMFQCSMCDRKFDTSRAMNIHSTSQHKSESRPEPDEDTEQYCCDVCDKSFTSKKSLTEHATNQCGPAVGEKIWYSCKECPKVFAHPKSVSRHVREHKLERERAELEKAAGAKSDDLTAEEAAYVIGAVDETNLKCGLCAKSFVNVKALAGHMKVHKGVAPFESLSAESGQSTSPHVSEPSEPEEGGKIFKCRVCDRSFPSGVGLGGHMRIHSATVAAAAAAAAAARKTPSEKTPSEKTPSESDALLEPVSSSLPVAKEIELSSTSVEEEEEFSCDLCKQAFYRKQDLGKHLRGHMAGTIGMEGISPDAPKCQVCQRLFSGEKSLKTHMYRYHRELIQIKRPPKSPAAEVTVSKVNDVDGRVRYEEELYKCNRCDQTYTNYRAFKSHALFNCVNNRKRPRIADLPERAVSEELFKCDYCEQSFLLRCHLQKHLKSRCNAVDLRNDPTIENDSADIPLPSKRARRSTFISPLYEYEPIGAHKCDECGKCFTTRTYLHRHMVSHKTSASKADDADSPAKLTFSFRRNGETTPCKQPNLEAHFRDMPYECVYCEKCFMEKELLLEHVRMHAEANELEGEELDDDDINFHAGEHFVIEDADGDEEHFIFEQHDDNEGYQCNECDDAYNDKLQMIIHMSHHLNSKLPPGQQKSLVIRADSTLLAPYKCRFCEERFINKRYRIGHLRKYHQDDIFQCDVCKKMFLWKANLRFHCRQHVVDTRYRCEYCRKNFTSKWFLKRHRKLHCLKKLVQELRDSHLAAAQIMQIV